jgi:hypothetical protein
MAGQPVDLERIPLRRRGRPDEVGLADCLPLLGGGELYFGRIIDVNGGVYMA